MGRRRKQSENRTPPQLAILDVEGPPFNQGYSIARRAREAVLGTLAGYAARLEQWAGISQSDWAAIALGVAAALAEYSPRTLEFLKGVSSGAGEPLERTLICFAAYDLWVHTGCSAVSSRDERGDIWLAQTFDWFADQKNQMMLVRSHDERGNVLCLGLAEAGFPTMAGVTGWGLGVLVNSLTARRAGEGTYARAALYQALACKSLDEFLSRMQNTRCVSAVHILAADAENACAVELSPQGNRSVTQTRHEPLVHTNHFIYGTGSEPREGLSADDIRESDARRAGIVEWMRCHGAPAARETQSTEGSILRRFRSLFSQHDPAWYPRTVCCHSSPEFDPLANSATLAAMVIHPRTKRLWLCPGNPCATEFRSVPFGRATLAKQELGGRHASS